jgi:hypothetical protein
MKKELKNKGLILASAKHQNAVFEKRETEQNTTMENTNREENRGMQ